MIKKMSLTVAVLVFTLALPLAAKVSYLVEITEPQHHLAQITVTIPAGHQRLDLMLPTWRTGKYQIINQANGIRKFSVKNEKGRSLNWQRLGKSHWQIDNPGAKKIKVSYQLYANELASRSRHIDSSHAYLDGVATFMYSPSLMLDEHQIRLKVPKGWQSYSGMKAVEAHRFVAKNYHQLASSPIETGENKLHEFSVDGKSYQLVIWGEGNYDSEKMADDLKKLVAQGKTIWQDYPFDKYVFIVHATSGASGATEHLNSTVIQRPRFKFAPQSEYLKFLRTASHEFVHTWNVKAYRPAPLVPYDYQRENYSDLLWIAEGSTSYLQDRLLLTAKLQSVDDYLKGLSDRVHRFTHKPGRQMQSVAESSFEKWISQGSDFANNFSVNIYSEGFFASWLFDFQMLEDSRLKSGYKDLHAALFAQVDQQSEVYQNYFAQPFDADMIKSLAKSLTGKDYQDWWQENIDSPLEIDLDNLLAKAGLQFAAIKNNEYLAWSGFNTKAIDGRMTVTRVERDSPAWLAGLTKGDHLIALEDMRVSHKNYASQLEKYKPGDTVKVTYFRNDRLHSTTLNFGKTSKKPREIERVESPSEKQKAFFKAWLGVDFPEPKE